MITLFCVRPKGFNIGNDVIFLGLRHLLRTAFGESVNIVQVPASKEGAPGDFCGLTPQTIHQMNLYGHGVVVGGGNLYENGGLDVDVHALRALRVPLMLFSLSHGRIYDHRQELVSRTDSMPTHEVVALNSHAALSVARDEATLEYLRGLGVEKAVVGGCPSLFLSRVRHPVFPGPGPAFGGTLLSVRHPQLTSMPLRDEARLPGTVLRLIDGLERDGFGPVRLLCHDMRDLTFAASLGNVEYVIPDDVHSYVEMLTAARLVVTFRLHAFVPCLSLQTPAINISYDERSLSLVRTLGLESWDINFIRVPDAAAEVRDRCSRIDDFGAIRDQVQPRWSHLEKVMESSMARFAALVNAYAAEQPVMRPSAHRLAHEDPLSS